MAKYSKTEDSRLVTAERPGRLDAASSSIITITTAGVPTGTGVGINYQTFSQNKPKTYGNQLYVWQTTSNLVPWDKDPDGQASITSDSSSSTQSITFDFENKGYIISYAVGAAPGASCATIFIPEGTQQQPDTYEYAAVDCRVAYVGTNFVQVQSTVLPGYSAPGNKNWIGIWQGAYVPYSGDPIKSVDVNGNYTNIEGVKLLIGTTYTVGYFMAATPGGRTTLAATSSFTVGSGG